MKTLHWTSRDLELLPDDGSRYEIIDGELYVTKQPDWQPLAIKTTSYGILPKEGARLTYEVIHLQGKAQHIILPLIAKQ